MTMTKPDSGAPLESADVEVETSASQRRWILIGTNLGLLAVMMAVTGLNVAQQSLATGIGASQTQLLWIINGFTVALAATLLPLGALGDRLGRKSVLLVGLGAFSVLNLVSVFANDPGVLIGLRVLVGISAAMIMPATLSTITAAFPTAERGRAVGAWSGVAGGGAVLGLLASAVLIDLASWRLLFLAPLVVALVAIVISIRMIPNTQETSGDRFDVVGSILSIVAIGGIVLAIHEGPEQGWASTVTVAAMVAGLVGLVGFVVWERRQTAPLLDVSVFSNRTLASGAFALMVMFVLMRGMFLVMIQLLQAVLEFSTTRSAVALLPMVVLLMGSARRAPAVVSRIGYRATMAASLAAAAGALAWLALLPSDPAYFDVLPALVLLGAALGTAMTPSTTAITESLPRDKQGVASALNDTVRELGGAVGVALIGSILAAGYRTGIAETADQLNPTLGHLTEEGIGGAYVAASQLGPDGLALISSAQSAFIDGWGTAMWIAAGIAALASVLAAAFIPATAHNSTSGD